MQSSNQAGPGRPHWHVQIGDVAWLIFVAALLLGTPEKNYNAYILLPLLGVFQIVESRLRVFSSLRGQIVSIGVKLVLSYLLVGYTGTLYSPYSPIFLIPAISAATIFDLWGVVAVSTFATALYLSFLLPIFVDWRELPEGYASTMGLRAAYYFIIPFLVYQQARAKRVEMERTREAAEQLAESNRNLRQAEASLRRSERLAALGQLSAGLAHELRNPLGTIRASAEILGRPSTRERPELLTEMAGYVASETDRINGLISRFLDFARPLQFRPQMAPLKRIANEAIRQTAAQAERNGVKVVSAVPAAMEAWIDPELMTMALGNLLQNAIHASGAGSEVKVSAEEAGDRVAISVEDHGEGISPSHLEDIFNPFFTTKSDGTGLGLAIVAKIMDEHNGKVDVSSQPGQGATFRLTVPKGSA